MGKNIRNRLLSKIKIDEATGCWNWTACVGTSGYGKIGIERKTKHAHRVSYELHCGPVPDGLFVCHRCDNRVCINPEHLFLGTRAENMADMTAKNRQARRSSHGRAKLSASDVIAIRSIEGVAQKDLAKQFGVSFQLISLVRRGKRWK